MLRRNGRTQFEKQEHNTQNVVALLNYLKCIALQKLMLRMQVFRIFFIKRKERIRNFVK
jgi:hypothetical protein